mmetsp:Transcript_42707/g.123448  ORF Transcript_42707/g.123448 Transcript_42707/m.123448 type:complete len:160 (+) Transcript_42707:352-831(+)
MVVDKDRNGVVVVPIERAGAVEVVVEEEVGVAEVPSPMIRSHLVKHHLLLSLMPSQSPQRIRQNRHGGEAEVDSGIEIETRRSQTAVMQRQQMFPVLRMMINQTEIEIQMVQEKAIAVIGERKYLLNGRRNIKHRARPKVQKKTNQSSNESSIMAFDFG